MENKSITVNVILDEKIFRKFAVFDHLYRQRRWVSLAAFAAIMLAFACVCFFMRASAEQAVMLGCVLLAVGFGLPAVFLLSLFNSIKAQVKAHKLTSPRSVYSLTLSGEPDGIQVRNTGECAGYKWDGIYGVYRVDGCTYLYIVSSRAFLLPDEQVENGPDALWRFLASVLPSEKLHDCRLNKK